MARRHNRAARKSDVRNEKRSGLIEQLEGRVLLTTALPSVIQMEYYDAGGEGVAYHDTTATNQGGNWRGDQGVDVEPTTDTGGGFDLCYTKPGEWIKYTVNVPSAGVHNILTRVASAAAGGKFHVEVDGANVTGTLTVPNTGGWQTYQSVVKSGVTLTAGAHVVKLSMDTAGSSGYVGNFNWVQIAPSMLVARPGLPDTTFGSNGYAEGTVPWAPDSVGSLATQTDGKIVSLSRFGLYRFNANGTADASFGGGSVSVYSDYGPWLRAFAIQPDGRIVMAGNDTSTFHTLVARYNTNGTLDTTFGSAGYARFSLGTSDFAGAILVQPDGKIVVGGSSTDASSISQYTLIRLNPAGTLDSTFGAGGKVYTNVKTTGGFTDLILLPDGSIVGCGQTVGPNFGLAGVLKYSSTGAQLVAATLTMPPSLNAYTGEQANRLELTPDGKVAVAGTAGFKNARTTWNQAFLSRLNPATLTNDSAFHSGTAVLGASGTAGDDVAVQSDGKILLAADSRILGYTAAGAVDSAFATGGVLDNTGVGSAVAIATDGKILTGGSVPCGWSSTSPVVERFLGSAPATTPFRGAPLPITSPIQAEDFDNLGYSDTTTANSGGQYRYTPVDIEKATDSGGGYDVCYTKAGEWLQYTVNVTTAKTYTFKTRVAALGTGGKFHITVDGTSLGSITVPNTGGWQSWQTITSGSHALTAGTHVIKLVMDTVGTSGFVANFNWMQLV